MSFQPGKDENPLYLLLNVYSTYRRVTVSVQRKFHPIGLGCRVLYVRRGAMR